MFLFRKEKKKKFITSKEYTICSKCGATIDANKRYCMKCGTLNYDHPDNQYMKKYISNKEIDKINREYFDSTHEEESVDDVYVGGKKLKEVKIENESSSVEAKNYKAGLVYVFMFSLVLFGGCYFYESMSLKASAFISVYVFSILISILSVCNIYRKAGYSGLTFFVPFYSIYVLCDMLLDNGILFLLSFIPVVNVGFLVYILYKLGKKFGINGVLSVIFFPIVILYIAFSDRVKFLGRVNNKDTKLVTIFGLLLLGIYIYFFLSNINVFKNLINM